MDLRILKPHTDTKHDRERNIPIQGILHRALQRRRALRDDLHRRHRRGARHCPRDLRAPLRTLGRPAHARRDALVHVHHRPQPLHQPPAPPQRGGRIHPSPARRTGRPRRPAPGRGNHLPGDAAPAAHGHRHPASRARSSSSPSTARTTRRQPPCWASPSTRSRPSKKEPTPSCAPSSPRSRTKKSSCCSRCWRPLASTRREPRVRRSHKTCYTTHLLLIVYPRNNIILQNVW